MVKKTPRACQPCTGCCDGWVQMNIRGAEVYPGQPCPYSTGKGCSDYEHRPVDPCINFRCGWIMEDSPLPDWMQPNNAKVIVIFDKLVWQGLPVDLAVPVGRKIPPRSLNWLKGFAEQQGRPLLYMEQIKKDGRFTKQQQLFGFGPPAFQEQVLTWSNEGVSLW